jgi:nucleoside-diphosphate-sugar epimerase
MVQKDPLIPFFARNFEKACSSGEATWESLRNANLFITGGTGFFGCWILRLLQWANRQKNLGIEAHLLSRNSAAFLEKHPEFKELSFVEYTDGDVRTFTFPKKQFSHMIHAATEASVKLNQESPLVMLDTINEGTRRALEFARTAKIPRFLLTSSGAVYGRQPPHVTHIPEDFLGAPDVFSPLAAYGEGKRFSELLCSLYSHIYSFDTIIARCFAFSGPYLPWHTHFALGNFLRDSTQGTSIQIQGDGTPYRSYLYGADLAFWILTLLARGDSRKAYHVGSEDDFTIRQIAEVVAETAQSMGYPSIQVNTARSPVPGQTSERYVPEVKRAPQELGLRQNFNLKESIRETLLWYRECSGSKPL